MAFHLSVSGASEAEKAAAVELAKQYCGNHGIDPVLLYQDVAKGIEEANDAWLKIELAAGVVFKDRVSFPDDFHLGWNELANILAAIKVSTI